MDAAIAETNLLYVDQHEYYIPGYVSLSPEVNIFLASKPCRLAVQSEILMFPFIFPMKNGHRSNVMGEWLDTANVMLLVQKLFNKY